MAGKMYIDAMLLTLALLLNRNFIALNYRRRRCRVEVTSMQKRYGKFQVIAFNIEILVDTTKNSFLQHTFMKTRLFATSQ
jgi:hypothetical protein